MPQSRTYLRANAIVWRTLMDIGMVIHKLAPPFAPSPDFTRPIPSTISPIQGTIWLYFYVPKSYHTRDKDSKKLYPVVINYHGGGFTLGRGTDDARWAGAVTEQIEAVVVSVDYRLAPEHPFPTAVEDGADTVLWVAAHAEELGLDKERIALSGFSSGGNLCFTVPLRLQTYFAERERLDKKEVDGKIPIIPYIRGIVSFYPTTDYTNPRAIRHRGEGNEPTKELPGYLTSLFDDSYLNTITGPVETNSPYLSPGVASEEMLTSLPENISIWACQWDGLRVEARRLAERLEARKKNSEAVAKVAREEGVDDVSSNSETTPAVDVRGDLGGLTEVKVKFRVVENAKHAWDKMPNPLGVHASVEKAYREACGDLLKAFDV